MSDEDWWLHLYVLFSRATCMEDMLVLRPPPRDLLESGPPQNVRNALARFTSKIAASRSDAEVLARRLGFPVL